jgi:hypothetical protein
MIEVAAVGAGLIAIAVIAFGLSVRFGMLLGRRIDTVIEARAAAGDASTEPSRPDGAGPNDLSEPRDAHVGMAGQEETRDE